MIRDLPQFGRCCLCIPLRAGVLAFGYLNIIFSIFMIVVYSLLVHKKIRVGLVYRGVLTESDADFCFTLYFIDILFNVLLVYGAHKQIVSYLRYFFYYTLSMTIALIVMEMLTLIDSHNKLSFYYQIRLISFFLTGLSIHLYLLFLVGSLLQKMNNSVRAYENQLHQFVQGESKVEGSGIKPSTAVPIERANAYVSDY